MIYVGINEIPSLGICIVIFMKKISFEIQYRRLKLELSVLTEVSMIYLDKHMHFPHSIFSKFLFKNLERNGNPDQRLCLICIAVCMV